MRKPINLTTVLGGYTRGWVIISKDFKKVIAHDKTFEGISKKAEKLSRQRAILMAVTDNYRGYVTSS